MKVRVSIVGILEDVLPSGKEVIETDSITASEILDALVKKYGRIAAEKLRSGTQLRDGLSMLVNGRNVRSLPDKFQTKLQNDDEVVITVQVSGG